MISNTKKNCSVLSRSCDHVSCVKKFIQKPQIAVTFLLFFALLGWFGGFDKALQYMPSEGYTTQEMQFFSVLKVSLEKTKDELSVKKKEFKITHDTLLKDLDKFKSELENSGNFRIEIEKGFIKKRNQLNFLDEEIAELIVSIDELSNALPAEGEIINIQKSDLRTNVKILKQQLEQYETALKQYVALPSPYSISDFDAFLRNSEFATSIRLLKNEVVELKSSDTSGKLESTRNRLLISFGALKAINGAVSIVQSIETGGSVVVAKASVRFGEWLDPINDLVEQASEFILYAVLSITIQEFLFAIGNEIGLSVIMPTGLLFFAISYLFTNDILKARCRKLSSSIIILALFAKLLVPTSVFVSDYVMEKFLLEKYKPAISKINANRTEIEKMRDVSFLTTISANTDGWFDTVENITFENIFMIITIFLFETILLPLVVGLIMLRSFQFFVFYK